MKTQPLGFNLILLTAAASLIQGCVGYNRVAFATKSNVGLDYDTKPLPTLQLNIGRKEIAVTPTFEGGGTPPLLASFGANPEGNAAGRFSFGIDQTFSGGDAAMVMATLIGSDYNPRMAANGQPTNASADTVVLYDSAITVSGVPTGRGTPYTTNATPFIFATDTSFGAKVSWSGAASTVPDSVHIGFRRKEGALAPVFASPSPNDSTKTVVRIPSFLATVEGASVVEGTTNKYGARQFFATGKAATRLAMQPDVRDAMAKRLDPAAYKGTADKNVEKQIAQADRIAEEVSVHGKVDEQKLKTVATDSGVVDPAQFAAKFKDKDKSELANALKGKYRLNVNAMVNNLGKLQ